MEHCPCGESTRIVAICCRPAPRGSTAARRRRGHGRLASFRVPSAPSLCSSLPPFFSVPMFLFLSSSLPDGGRGAGGRSGRGRGASKPAADPRSRRGRICPSFSGTAAFGAPPVACKKPLVLGAGSEGRVVMVRRRSTNSPMAFKEWRCHMREELKMNDLFSVRTATVGRHR